jgi:hypothetical protein
MDPLIEQMCEGIESEPDVSPYVGKWPQAVLTDVQTRDKNDYGYSVQLQWNLRGADSDKPLQFTKIINLPGVNNGDEKANFINGISRDKLASLLHAGGLFPAGRKPSAVADDGTYEKIVGLFSAHKGNVLPVKVSQRKDSDQVDVYGLRSGKKQ